MFEDILKPVKPKADVLTEYICKYSDECNHSLCLHKHPHIPLELGRPEDEENKPNSDCSLINCKDSKHKDAICIPIKE